MNGVKFSEFSTVTCNSVKRGLRRLLVFAYILLAACGGGGGSGVDGVPSQGAPDTASATFVIRDVAGEPVDGASVTLGNGKNQLTETTGSDGIATFREFPTGEAPYSVRAAGFGSLEGTLELQRIGEAPNRAYIYLYSTDAWATPRLVVLGTRMIDLGKDGSELIFSADVAVVDRNAEALETLTSAQFSLRHYDCGWGGPRDCASDAAGNDTGIIWFTDGNPIDFALQPPVERHPYIAEILVDQSAEVNDWSALKFFFSSIGPNDAASLSSVKTEGNFETYTVHGPYTNDGGAFLEAIAQLSANEGDPPSMLDSLVKSIQRLAAAENPGARDLERAVVVASSSGWGLSVAEFDTATTLAKELGVRVSGAGRANYGYPEIAVRTGGFTAEVDDPRQRPVLIRAMDQLLAGTTPYYRMTFRIEGEPGTFVSGGNAKVVLNASVPTSIRHRDPYAMLDVAIP